MAATSTTEQLARMRRFMALKGRQTALIMQFSATTVTSEVVEQLEALRAGLVELALRAAPEDTLATPRMVDESIADVTEWIARAHEALSEVRLALDYYELAAALYDRSGISEAAARVRDRVAHVRAGEVGATGREDAVQAARTTNGG